MNPELKKTMAHIQGWGRQTIANAMSIRADDLHKSPDSQSQAAAAMKEASQTANDIWTETAASMPPDVQIGHLTLAYVRRIFDWTWHHLDKTPRT